METKETKQETFKITSHEIQEAMEQVRAGFTVSRIALGAATLLYTVARKGEKWAKKFTKIQNDYHSFLLATYKELEEKYNEYIEKEASNENDNNDRD